MSSGAEVIDGRAPLFKREAALEIATWLQDNIAPIKTPSQHMSPAGAP